MTLERLTAEGAQVVTRAEVWLDGFRVDEPAVLAGSVTYDASARVSRTCTGVELLGEIPLSPTDPLSPIGSELRLFRGARDWTGELFEEPLGRYAFDSSSISRESRTVTVDGFDYAQIVTDARFEEPFVVPAGTLLVDAISLIVESRLPPVLWRDPDLAGFGYALPTDLVLGEEVEHDPMADVRRLADAGGLEVYFSRSGRLTVRETPDPEVDNVSRSYVVGSSATYLGSSRELTGRPYNVVVARGETADETPPVVAVAEDDVPASPSFVGRYRRPYFLVSGMIQTEAQAFGAASAQLRRLLGLSEVVTFSVIPNPALDVWQIIEAVDPDVGIDARYIVDRVELPLRPGEATITTRRRRI